MNFIKKVLNKMYWGNSKIRIYNKVKKMLDDLEKKRYGNLCVSCKNTVLISVKKLLDSLDASEDRFTEDEMNNCVLVCINKSTYSLLASGTVHRYTNILTEEGELILKIYLDTMDIVVKAGGITQKEANDTIKLLREEMSTVG